MTRKEALAKFKNWGIKGEIRKSTKKTEIRVTDPDSLKTVSENIQEIRENFQVTLYGKCSPKNLNPRTPDEMESCSSCYISNTTYR